VSTVRGKGTGHALSYGCTHPSRIVQHTRGHQHEGTGTSFINVDLLTLIILNTRLERLIHVVSAGVQAVPSVPSRSQSLRAAHQPGRRAVRTSTPSNMEPSTTDQRTNLAETSLSSARCAIQFSPLSLGDLRARCLLSQLMPSGATT
jgi:hypothetical protein